MINSLPVQFLSMIGLLKIFIMRQVGFKKVSVCRRNQFLGVVKKGLFENIWSVSHEMLHCIRITYICSMCSEMFQIYCRKFCWQHECVCVAADSPEADIQRCPGRMARHQRRRAVQVHCGHHLHGFCEGALCEPLLVYQTIVPWALVSQIHVTWQVIILWGKMSSFNIENLHKYIL